MSKQPTVTLLESLFGQTKEYVDTRLELFKLKLIDKTTSIASSIVSIAVLFVVFLIFFIVFNIGIALLIGEIFDKAYAGFLILAAIYAIAGFLLFSQRKKFIKDALTGVLIKKFF